MNNAISRVTRMTLFCLTLSGCAVGIKSTNLEVVSPRPEDAQLLASVGFVFHDESYATHDKKYIESEKKSWIDALSTFTNKENIYTLSKGVPISIITPTPELVKTQPNALSGAPDQGNANSIQDSLTTGTAPENKSPNVINSFTEFEKSHPVVHVFINAISKKKGLIANDMINETPMLLSFLTFWITPSYLSTPYTASFTLSMPEEKKVPSSHWDYPYNRQEYYWLPLLPMADSSITVDGKIETDMQWKIEEKRRLVLMFLKDAKPLLQEH